MPILRDVLLSLFLLLGVPSAVAEDAEAIAKQDVSCGGVLTQGALVICHGPAGETVRIGGTKLTFSEADGSAQIGLSRKAPATLGWSGPNGQTGDLTITPRMDKETVLKGIPCDKIDARTEEQKAHASRSWVKKQEGWKTFKDGRGALDGFIQPAEGRISSPFGFVRRYVTEGCPEKVRPHFGYDIAAPVGQPIIAPAAGIVTLAEDDLYYEGGTVFLDHGHGLVSLFLHMSALDVKEGDVVVAGDPIGKIGATGRVTGPHLHWAVKWRNPGTDDRSGDFYIDPALLLQLEPAK